MRRRGNRTSGDFQATSRERPANLQGRPGTSEVLWRLPGTLRETTIALTDEPTSAHRAQLLRRRTNHHDVNNQRVLPRPPSTVFLGDAKKGVSNREIVAEILGLKLCRNRLKIIRLSYINQMPGPRCASPVAQ